MKKLIRRVMILILNPLFSFQFLIPKSKKIVVFGSWFGERFADNSRWYYQYLIQNKKKYNIKKVIFVTDRIDLIEELMDKGFEVYKKKSFKGIWYQIISKYHFIDLSHVSDTIGFLNINSKVINLWHGIPLKKIGDYYNRYWNNPILKFIDILTTPGYSINNYVLCISKFHKELMKSEFKLKDTNCIIAEYPRTYYMKSSERILLKSEELLRNKIIDIKNNGYSVVGYIPTFRDSKTLSFLGTNIEEKKNLNEFLCRMNNMKYKIISKLHFSETSTNINYDSVINVDKNVDLYTIIDLFDILITDYSSIFFDFLQFNKPIVFYPYDIEYYLTRDRGLLLDYDEFTPGKKVYNIKQLEEYLIELNNNGENISFINKRNMLSNIIYNSNNTIDSIWDQINN